MLTRIFNRWRKGLKYFLWHFQGSFSEERDKKLHISLNIGICDVKKTSCILYYIVQNLTNVENKLEMIWLQFTHKWILKYCFNWINCIKSFLKLISMEFVLQSYNKNTKNSVYKDPIYLTLCIVFSNKQRKSFKSKCTSKVSFLETMTYFNFNDEIFNFEFNTFPHCVSQ